MIGMTMPAKQFGFSLTGITTAAANGIEVWVAQLRASQKTAANRRQGNALGCALGVSIAHATLAPHERPIPKPKCASSTQNRGDTECAAMTKMNPRNQ
jgi:hypothetical protein